MGTELFRPVQAVYGVYQLSSIWTRTIMYINILLSSGYLYEQLVDGVCALVLVK